MPPAVARSKAVRPIPRLTPTLRRLLAVLDDGQWHNVWELVTYLDDDLARYSTVRKHICLLRRYVRQFGHDIVCVIVNRRTAYQRIVVYRPEVHGEGRRTR